MRTLKEGVNGLKIAFSPNLGYVKNVDPEVAHKVAQAAKIFESLGAHVELVDPGFEDPMDISTGLWFLGSFHLERTYKRPTIQVRPGLCRSG